MQISPIISSSVKGCSFKKVQKPIEDDNNNIAHTQNPAKTNYKALLASLL